MVTLYTGDCREVLATLPAASVDAVVTDPPYDLTDYHTGGDAIPGKFGQRTEEQKALRNATRKRGGFMGKEWDGTGIAFDPETWLTVYRVLKPGAHLLAFGGPRTFHRMTCAIEDAGFEIRDCLSWLFGGGFPKSHNLCDCVANQREPIPGPVDQHGWVRCLGGCGGWIGLGTALKPAWEPIILARKPLPGTVAGNVEQRGTGALNIDGCRIGLEGGHRFLEPSRGKPAVTCYGTGLGAGVVPVEGMGRWPANVCLDEEAAAALDAATPHTSERARTLRRNGSRQMDGWGLTAESEGIVHGDAGGPSRFFYTSKASSSERNRGLENLPLRPSGMRSDTSGQHITQRNGGDPPLRANHHPTVKPVDLMRWLVRLVTPPAGIVLDPFMGSGTTGIACVYEERDFIGVEREAEYVEIARRRIEHAQGPMFANVEVLT